LYYKYFEKSYPEMDGFFVKMADENYTACFEAINL